MAPTRHPATGKLPMKLFQGGTRSTLYVETHVSPFRLFGEVKHILASLIQSDRMICAEGSETRDRMGQHSLRRLPVSPPSS